jgi:signal transduction histidine kinase
MAAIDPERSLEALDAIDATGRGALVELRRLLGLLRPGADEEAALPTPGLAGIEALVDRARGAGLPVELAVEGDVRPLPAGPDLAAYRVVQEALTNTLKHAGPATASVRVRWGDDEVELLVADTGHGGAGPRGEGARAGLAGMRERMALYGGALEAGPRPGGGFEVRARLPLRREEVHAA